MIVHKLALPGGAMVKKPPAMQGTQGTQVPFLGQEDYPGEGNGSPHQYSCLENPMDREAWWALVHGVTESDMTMHTHMHVQVGLNAHIITHRTSKYERD